MRTPSLPLLSTPLPGRAAATLTQAQAHALAPLFGPDVIYNPKRSLLCRRPGERERDQGEREREKEASLALLQWRCGRLGEKE